MKPIRSYIATDVKILVPWTGNLVPSKNWSATWCCRRWRGSNVACSWYRECWKIWWMSLLHSWSMCKDRWTAHVPQASSSRVWNLFHNINKNDRDGHNHNFKRDDLKQNLMLAYTNISHKWASLNLQSHRQVNQIHNWICHFPTWRLKSQQIYNYWLPSFNTYNWQPLPSPPLKKRKEKEN